MQIRSTIIGEVASSLASSLPCVAMLAFLMERAKYSECMLMYRLYMSCTATIPVDHKLLTLTFSVTEAQPTNCRPFLNLSVTSRRERPTSASPGVNNQVSSDTATSQRLLNEEKGINKQLNGNSEALMCKMTL